MIPSLYIWQYVLPAANGLLPVNMLSERADFLSIAISYQESRHLYRKQLGGPAKGFWQFERIGVADVLQRPVTRPHILNVLRTLGYDYTIETSYMAIEHNDVLAAVYARLTLWLDPQPIPPPENGQDLWEYYLRNWRPGAPKPATWPISIATAMEIRSNGPDQRNV